MSTDINIKISEDRKKITLTFKDGKIEEKPLELNQAELEDLIRVLGTVRWAMAEGQKLPEITGAHIKPAYQTKWAVQRDNNVNGTLLAFQHPGYGAVGFVLSDTQLKDYTRALQKSLKIKRVPNN
ncbi:hypothetical protein [Commensalibacter oyaizuii]|uniref:Uncharacterized protein n=1 Tax=Commensalibacter oyaizuii TaxID=3043873 RepID=A0ABT6Q1I1_9PROT|nr:hypothetical protein [Commensalibacter sp. TBRC 16381]MDI2090957.1 hypothetical protein [Commensalibacter sp. TBRC 16381]